MDPYEDHWRSSRIRDLNLLSLVRLEYARRGPPRRASERLPGAVRYEYTLSELGLDAPDYRFRGMGASTGHVCD